MFDPEVWKDWHLRLGVILLSVLVFFPGLGDFGLWDPWEVHYGEVGRSMVERGDWISPWWGSYWQAPGQTPEGEYFFSKPVLLLWMMGIGLQLFGFSELGIRFGVAVIAAMGVVSVYLAGSHVWSGRVGLREPDVQGDEPEIDPAAIDLVNDLAWQLRGERGAKFEVLEGRALRYNQRDTLLNGDFIAVADARLAWRDWLE